MLVRDYIVLVLGVNGLVVRRHIDLIIGELVPAEVLKEIGISRAVEVDVGVVGIFGLGIG